MKLDIEFNINYHLYLYMSEELMEIIDITFEGVKLIKPKVFHDDRGFFWECYREPLYKELGIDCGFVQDNHSYSKKGTIRGMHFQRSPGQAKLISVIEGRIFDVVVDIRPSSPTFGKWTSVYLDGKSHHQLFIPVGFAHGFCVMSDTVHVLYKVSSLYDPKEEKGFAYNDPSIGIDWPIADPIISERDLRMPSFEEAFL
jgi:dTDP-4-dehydrorhamnose 3,5-epimerase